MRSPRTTKLAAAAPAAAIALVLAVLAATAPAAEAPTRAAYVERLESVCKSGSEATERAVRGVKADLEAERLARAAVKFSAADRIFTRTLAAIAPLPRPPADAAKLAKWFGYLGQEERYLAKIVAALRAGDSIASQHYTARFVHNGNLANRTVLAFGFDYCSFDFARFG